MHTNTNQQSSFSLNLLSVKACDFKANSAGVELHSDVILKASGVIYIWLP